MASEHEALAAAYPYGIVMRSGALGRAAFSPCGRYRYALERCLPLTLSLGRGPLFVGLNPSTADHDQDDPTIRRLRGYSRAWGYDNFDVLNLFALRATDPNKMFAVDGDDARSGDPLNLAYLMVYARHAELVVACWGCDDRADARADLVERELSKICQVHALAVNAQGRAMHPLYLWSGLKPVPINSLRRQRGAKNRREDERA